MNRLLTLIVLLVTTAHAWSAGEYAHGFAGGTGTEADPYQIATLTHLSNLAFWSQQSTDFGGTYFVMTADISFSGFDSYNMVWGIGFGNRQFNGSFDGQGHKLMDVTTASPMFNYVGQHGVVKNLTIDGVTAKGGAMLIYETGPLADHVAGLVENCHVTGISHDYASTGQTNYASGMVGYLTQTGLVRDCSTSGSATVACGYGGIVGKNYSGLVTGCRSDMVITIVRGSIAVGGIGGLAQSYNNGATPNFENCEFVGQIKQRQLYDGNKAGGICGDGTVVNITRCVNRGTLISTGFSGGIAGVTSGSSRLSECYNMGLLQDFLMSQGERTASYGMSDYVAGIAGQISGGTIERCFNGGTLQSVRGAGGLIGSVGSGLGAECLITDCYNAGLIDAPNVWKTGNTTIQKAGGLVAEFANVYDLTITHCLSLGTLANAVAARGRDCEYLGYDLSPADILLEGNYYDNQVVGNTSQQGGLSTALLTSGEALQGFDPAVWLFEPGRYPRLRCHAAASASLLCATPYYLASGDTHTKVKHDFTVGDTPGVSWSLSATAQASLDGTTVHVVSGEQSQVVTLTSSLEGMERQGLVTIYPDLFAGSGTADDPYLIEDYADMVRLSRATNEDGLTFDGDCLQLVGDIDMQGHSDFGLMSLTEATPFLGTLDGNGHALRGFSMRNDLTQTQNAGLFGYVGERGVIKNLVIAEDGDLGLYLGGGTIAAMLQGTIEHVLVLPRTIHSAAGAGNFGGIVCSIEPSGRVIDCYVGSDISLSGAANYVAGIARYNYGVVDGCQFAGNIGGEAASYVGGLVAEHYGSINDCLSSGFVTGNAYVGGVTSRCLNLGMTEPSITNTLSTGQVTYSTQVDYAGAVTGQISGTCDHVWYDRQIGLLDNVRVAGIEGKLTREIVVGWNGGSKWTADGVTYPRLALFAHQPLSEFYSFPVTFADGENRGDLITSATVYAAPGLTSTLDGGDDFDLRSGTLTARARSSYSDDILVQTYDGFTRRLVIGSYGQMLSQGDGTASNPWVIGSEADLAKLVAESNTGLTSKHFVGKHFCLGGDITLSADIAGISCALTGGNAVNNPRWFRGTIDGAGHTIGNLNISSTNAYGLVGLVGYLGPGGVVKDLTIGSGSVQGVRFVGSVVGKCLGTVSGIVNHAQVTATTGGANVGSGGVVGYVGPSGVVSHLTNYGTVTNTQASGICYTGGVLGVVVGDGTRTFERLAGHGRVSGPMGVAGVVANSRLVSYDDVVNYGDVVGTAATSNLNGGCFGDLVSTPHINNARNYGAVSGSTGVGGVISRYITGPGQVHCALEVTGCLNAGDITGRTSNVGGIVGMSDTTRIHVVDCANVGRIACTAASLASGTPGAGGIVGGGSPIIQGCYNAGVVSGVNCIGGLLGRPANNDAQVDIISSLNVGWLEGYAPGSANVGAIAGYRSSASRYSDVLYDSQMCETAAVAGVDVDGTQGMGTIELVSDQGRYPVPGQLAQDSALAVASMPVFLAHGDVRWQVTQPFDLGAAAGFTWSGDSVFVIVGSHVSIMPATHGDYAVTVTNGSHSRRVPLTVEFAALRGDVDGDGQVDVADVNILINIMLGRDSADNYDGRAYVTQGDAIVDVADINAVINIMLGK